MNEKDWPGVSAIYLEGIASGKATLIKELPAYAQWDAKQDPNLRFVAVDQETDTVTGFISAQSEEDKNALVSVYVGDMFKKRGIGTRLMEKLQEESAHSGCIILRSCIFEDNIPSIGLHLKTGFQKTGQVFTDNDHRCIEVYVWRPAEKLFLELSEAIVQMDEDAAAALAQTIVSSGIDAWEAIEKGLVQGMERAGGLFEQEEYFIPELLMCSDAMNAAMSQLKPHVKKAHSSRGRIVIGSIAGDTHDIGKNIVALMIESAGFDVLNLGRDVPARRFVDAAVEFNADIVAMSSLMTTTMENMADVIRLLILEKRRGDFALMVGGRPLSRAFAKRIGADYYAKNAAEALRTVKKIMKVKNGEC